MKRLEDLDERELGILLTACGNVLVEAFTRQGVEKPLFALVVFNDPAIGQYISNCRREDMIRALRETADRLENREDVVRGGPTP